METKTLSKHTQEIIDQYLNFRIELANCSIPYVNNKTARTKVALRAYKGKGSPQDIKDELEILVTKNHIDRNSLTNESLKKLLVDNNLGIECSGFAYHILDTESQSRGTGSLKKNLAFINCRGLFGKIICSIKPAENCDVATFANDANSRIISVNEITPGDIITMTNDPESDVSDRNHILIVSEVSSIPDPMTPPPQGGGVGIENSDDPQQRTNLKITYFHSIAYPEDGIYGTGVRQGFIEVSDPNKPITEAKWVENSKDESTIRLISRAQKSKTEIRRLNWF